MITEAIVKTKSKPSAAADTCSECGLSCHRTAVFKIDKKLGYYKLCPHCGNIEYLHRRFLRLDRQSRQWQ